MVKALLNSHPQVIEKIKEIISTDDVLKISEEDCELYEWMSNYYHYPVGMLINDILPNYLKRPRKLNKLI